MKFQKSQAVTFRNNGKAIPDIAGILKIGKSAIAAFLKKILILIEIEKKLEDYKK